MSVSGKVPLPIPNWYIVMVKPPTAIIIAQPICLPLGHVIKIEERIAFSNIYPAIK